MNNNKEEIIKLRLKIDTYAQVVFKLDVTKNVIFQKGICTQITKCYDSLILSKAWLGKVLGELKEPSPYVKDGKRHNIRDIEPVTEKATLDNSTIEELQEILSVLNHIEKVDFLREEIATIEKQIRVLSSSVNKDNLFNNWFPVIQYIAEARFWLGFELGRIRDSQ